MHADSKYQKRKKCVLHSVSASYDKDLRHFCDLYPSTDETKIVNCFSQSNAYNCVYYPIVRLYLGKTILSEVALFYYFCLIWKIPHKYSFAQLYFSEAVYIKETMMNGVKKCSQPQYRSYTYCQPNKNFT